MACKDIDKALLTLKHFKHYVIFCAAVLRLSDMCQLWFRCNENNLPEIVNT